MSSAGTRVTLAAYSGPNSLRVLIPWTLLDKPEDAGHFADRIDALPRGFQGDSTAIGSAIAEAAKLFDRGGQAPRQVIDLVSNGFSNSGIDPADARDRVTKRGLIVNAPTDDVIRIAPAYTIGDAEVAEFLDLFGAALRAVAESTPTPTESPA